VILDLSLSRYYLTSSFRLYFFWQQVPDHAIDETDFHFFLRRLIYFMKLASDDLTCYVNILRYLGLK